jgi:hypothetical protein
MLKGSEQEMLGRADTEADLGSVLRSGSGVRVELGGDQGGAHWTSRRGVLASWREAPTRSIGHFQQGHAVGPLTGRTESSKSDYLAPQTGLERMTFWLTAERPAEKPSLQAHTQKSPPRPEPGGRVGAAHATG